MVGQLSGQDELKGGKSCPFSQMKNKLREMKPIGLEGAFVDLKRSKKKVKILLYFISFESFKMVRVT